MTGWLVVNAYLRSKKFTELYDALVKAAEKRNVSLRTVTNEDVLLRWDRISENLPDFVLYWDKDLRAGARLEECGLKLFNSAGAVEISDDKALTFLALEKAGVAVPDTLVCPLSFEKMLDRQMFLNVAAERFSFPFVLKESRGSFGAQVHLANNMEDALNIVTGFNGRECIAQEYIASSRGRDVRIQMVGDKPVAAMLRENPCDFRANLTNGGTATPWQPSDEQVALAKAATRALKLDFAGVDLLFGDRGQPLVCEVNSNAHFTNITACTGVQVADAIIEHVISETRAGN